MAGETFVDLVYWGIDLGQTLRIEGAQTGTAYLHHDAPMPIDSELMLITQSGLEIPVRVLDVREKVSGSDRSPGMQLESISPGPDAQAWWHQLIHGGGEKAAAEPEAAPAAEPEAAPAPEPEAAPAPEPAAAAAPEPAPASEAEAKSGPEANADPEAVEPEAKSSDQSPGNDPG